jgi:transposase InsO family protein
MSATLSPSQEVPYGVARVCRAWEVPRSSFYDWRRLEALPAEDRPAPRKRGPKTELSDEELAELIRELLAAIEAEAGITGEGYRKVHARLRFAGTRVGRERVLRVMREHGLLAPTRTGRRRGPRIHDGTVTTDRTDLMWGTDATRIATRHDGDVWVFAAVDHCNTECVGIHAAKKGTRFEALVPVLQGVRKHFGSAETGVAVGLALRHDHGTQYMSRAFQEELRFLGIESSPSFVAAPEGNGVAERFFRTLKEQLLWVRTFDTVEDLRLALLEFQRTYNERWILARHAYRTPNQVRADLSPMAA